MLPAQKFITFDQYLAIEAETGLKHEYFNGEVFAMAGGSPNHSALQAQLTGQLYAQLKGRPCRLFSADLRVTVEAAGLYTYPDLSVVCGGAQFDDHNTLLNPTLLAEVLSPSTEAYDRGAKFGLYQQLPSLRQYLLISQDQRMVHLYTRSDDGKWTFEQHTQPDATIDLTSIGCTLNVGELYEQVELPLNPPHPFLHRLA